MTEKDKEIEDLRNEIAVLRARLELQTALWEQVWQGLRMQETAIARTLCFGEFRDKVVDLPK